MARTSNTNSLDVGAAAAELGCSAWLVRKMLNTGELRHVRLGRLIRIPRSEVERFQQKRLEESETSASA